MVFKKIKNKYKTSRKTSYVLVVTMATPFPPLPLPPPPPPKKKQTNKRMRFKHLKRLEERRLFSKNFLLYSPFTLARKPSEG